METIILKAIEGGYMNLKKHNISWEKMHFEDKPTEEHIILDPLFWQALGKGCGWGKEISTTETGEEWGKRICIHCGIDTSYQPPKESGCNHAHYPEACEHCSKISITWKQHALKFHEINLTSGWDEAVKYLSDLTKPQ